MSQTTERIHELVDRLNRYRQEYYNENAPSVSDAVYDHLYDELAHLEAETGIILSSSPTQTVGYQVVGNLPTVKHDIPLLSLDKTKSLREVISFLKGKAALLMLKLDGLTIKLVYEGGKLTEASTRGDGDVGEVITHNVAAFCNVPMTIPYQKHLEVSGEGFIHKSTFERLKNSRDGKLLCLMEYGFGICPFQMLDGNISEEFLQEQIESMQALADLSDIPIDGMVIRFEDLAYSESLGRTGHHYHDGIAFKFEDDVYETIFRSIEWQTGRSGEIAPVAVFDTVEIDGCEVSRASLHNLTFIKNLELYPGCRILVSKRNMIIPHVEENLDRGNYQDMIPQTCPCCGRPARTYSRAGDKGRIVETLHCDNPECGSRILQRFVHFAEKKAMNIKGLSEATLDQLIRLGALKSYQDLYHLDRYRKEIIALEGLGEKSYENLIASINESRNTTFVRFLVAMDIPLIGRTASRILDGHFHGSLWELKLAALDRFDFTCLEGIGDIMSSNLHKWFRNPNNLLLWGSLQNELHFENGLDAQTSREENNMNETTNNTFAGCTIVATGKLENFTRDGINAKIISLGATPGSSVTKKTDYLICGEKAGSKLAKAQQLGVKVLTEQEFLDMLSA